MAKESGKSIDVQIADLEAQIVKLREEQDKLRAAAAPQYPKHVQVPVAHTTVSAPTQTVIVNSEAEEKAVLSGKSKGTPIPAGPEVKAQADADRAKEAADKAEAKADAKVAKSKKGRY